MPLAFFSFKKQSILKYVLQKLIYVLYFNFYLDYISPLKISSDTIISSK